MEISALRQALLSGLAIPALPLALDRRRRWSPRRQQAVLRYYLDAGVGGVAVGVHSTQFEIRESKHGLFEPVLELATKTITSWPRGAVQPLVRVAGICGATKQALSEVELVRKHGYDAALLSLGAWKSATERAILRHCQQVGREFPLIGFYLQPSVGGRLLSKRFWREFAEIPHVVAVKIAPFNRYQTLDVVQAVLESGREDVALYTGNDDNIIVDLLTRFEHAGRRRFISGGLLGQWGVWTQQAVRLLDDLKRVREKKTISTDWLTRNAALTDANAAIFDPAHGFAGCIPGIQEVLRRQGIFETTACLNPHEQLSPGQAEELDRVTAAYPWLIDDPFVAKNLDRWLA